MTTYKNVDGKRVLMTPAEEAEFNATRAVDAGGPRQVPKSVVIQRLIDAGKINAAYAALAANPAAFARWFSPDLSTINSDNLEAIALLQAIGADPDVILA